MKRNVTSKDPRKALIVATMKRKFGVNKVTLLTEYVDGDLHYFAANGLRYVSATRSYQSGISVEVTWDEVIFQENVMVPKGSR